MIGTLCPNRLGSNAICKFSKPGPVLLKPGSPIEAMAETKVININSEAETASAELRGSDVRGSDVRGAEVRNAAALVEVQLVRRAQAGDLDAFRELFDSYYQRATSVAFGVVGNQADAQDIVQEAFIKVHRKFSSFKGESSFYTWLYRIVYNLAIDTARKRYRKVENLVGDSVALDQTIQKAASGSAVVAEISNPELELERKALRAHIAKAMADLSPEHRAVITLREIDGLSYSEISEVAGCSKGTVMSRLFHARRKLQKALTASLGENSRKYIEDANVQRKDGLLR